MDMLAVDTWYCIERYEQLMNELEHMNAYEFYIESLTDPVIKSKEKQNQEKGKEAGNFITRFFNNIIKLISTLIKSIGNFVSLSFMTAEERKRYEAMKNIRENDPRLKGKSFTVADFRKVEKEYADAENRIKSTLNNMKKGVVDNVDDIVSSVRNLIGRNISGLYATVTPSVAMKLASANIEEAKHIQATLVEDKKYMEMLEREIGKKEARKFEKQVKHAANRDTSVRSKLYMALYELKHGKARTLNECWAQIYDQIQILLGYKGSKIGRVITAVKNSDIISRASKNDALMDTAKSAMSGMAEGKKKAKKEQRLEAKKQLLGGKDRDTNSGVYQPRSDFMSK